MIAINELSTSYMTEMEAHEVDSIFGGSLFDNYYGSPNNDTAIVITPVGGNADNVQVALTNAIDYAGLNGFVHIILHGGSTGFLAVQPTFNTFPS